MRQRFFWRGQALGNEEAVGSDAQRRVMMKPAPVTAFEMAEPKLLLEFLIVALDAPAQLGQPHEFLEWSARRQGAQEVLGGFAFPARPFDEQPLLGRQFSTPIVAMRTANAHGSKA